jgi:predicted DNA repair protein MutK
MSSGLLAILDDVVAIAKVAATALDDAAGQASKAGSKALGIVIDDAAVTPRYVVGFGAERELPIIGKIAWGSLKNKMLFLLPGALVLSLLAPWSIVPLLMLGGAFLCYEGYEKVVEFLGLAEHHDAAAVEDASQTPRELEDAKISSAIRTDFILSAEIMAIALSTVSTAPLWLQSIALAVVGIGMTGLVYGAVAIIVKADDAGVAMARSSNAAFSAAGRALVMGMPGFLKALSFVGMIAMLWVGGGILLHGLYELGLKAPEAFVKDLAMTAGAASPVAGGFIGWAVGTALAASAGLVVGAIVAPTAHKVLMPAAAAVMRRFTATSKA